VQAKSFLRNMTVLAGLTAMLGARATAGPVLTPGVWANITPVAMTPTNNVFCQGMAVDPANPSTLYLCVFAYTPSLGGLYKTTNGGSNWAKVGQLDEPIHITVDPRNSNHLYCVDGVRGSTEGFWVSNDAGNTWTMPQGFQTTTNTAAGNSDLYSLAVDPTDFNHVLVSYHYPWKDTNNAGVLESKDGGTSWIVHQPPAGSLGGYGMDVFFLYNPATHQGDANTWLFTAQAGGFFRTTDAGANWTLVNPNQMTHGGDQLYRTSSGVLYAGGYQYPYRSTDNGVSWQQISNRGLPYSWYMGICGDGTNLFTSPSASGQPFYVSPENNGLAWTAYNGGAQTFSSEPFEMAYDSTNHIMYSASWGAGLLALRTGAPAPEPSSLALLGAGALALLARRLTRRHASKRGGG
jgi:photosystem II stability/assembly factor-like uncharacterized protein